MTIDDKLTAIRDVIQQDIGNRGLARDPAANLINACPEDFAAACRSIAEHPHPVIGVVTGFWIPSAKHGETDGPLGAIYLWRTLGGLSRLNLPVAILSDTFCERAIRAGVKACGVSVAFNPFVHLPDSPRRLSAIAHVTFTHFVALERVGPSHTPESIVAQGGSEDAFRAEVPAAHHDRCHTMRGIDITENMRPAAWLFEAPARPPVTIGIGDGGNEIGMGKIAWDTIRRNIPGGSPIACRVPTDHLIVCGVSNWGAYALAAGVALARGITPPADWFDREKERAILTFMVEHGPLVDGMSGQCVPRVDGLAFEEYAKVLERIGEIARA